MSSERVKVDAAASIRVIDCIFSGRPDPECELHPESEEWRAVASAIESALASGADADEAAAPSPGSGAGVVAAEFKSGGKAFVAYFEPRHRALRLLGERVRILVLDESAFGSAYEALKAAVAPASDAMFNGEQAQGMSGEALEDLVAQLNAALTSARSAADQ